MNFTDISGTEIIVYKLLSSAVSASFLALTAADLILC